MRFKGNQNGQSLIEIIVALGVFLVLVGSVGYLVYDTYLLGRDADERTQAVFIAKEGLEAARSIRDSDWNDLATGDHGITITGGNWVFSGTNNVIGKYTRSITVSDVAQDEKEVISEVTWNFQKNETRTVTLTSYFTNWR